MVRGLILIFHVKIRLGKFGSIFKIQQQDSDVSSTSTVKINTPKTKHLNTKLKVFLNKFQGSKKAYLPKKNLANPFLF